MIETQTGVDNEKNITEKPKLISGETTKYDINRAKAERKKANPEKPKIETFSSFFKKVITVLRQRNLVTGVRCFTNITECADRKEYWDEVYFKNITEKPAERHILRLKNNKKNGFVVTFSHPQSSWQYIQEPDGVRIEGRDVAAHEVDIKRELQFFFQQMSGDKR